MTVYVLGGHQSDFRAHLSRAGGTLFDLLGESVRGGLEASGLREQDVEVAHVGNFTGELFARQGHLGGLFASISPAFDGVPSVRHEAACASGSAAILAATADLEAGRYDVACVTGIEQMRNVDGRTAGEYLGVAAWTGREGEGARFLWPAMFDRIAVEYEERHGLDRKDLVAVARQAYDNARDNPLAQTRGWTLTDDHFGENAEHNPVVEGKMRRVDCAQVTDGAATVLLCSERYLREHPERAPWARIAGFGHRTSHMHLEEKLGQSRGQRFVFPQLRATITDAWRRAGLSSVEELDCVEVHDCFTITGHAIVDHLDLVGADAVSGLFADGATARGGRLAVNPGGGLIGIGHPVGATGVRMLLDASRQVSGRAGACQVPGAKLAQTVNIGGSVTTAVSFVVRAVA